jgi:hypothetical protein
MIKLVRNNFRFQAIESFQRIFCSGDPYSPVFCDDVTGRLLLFPIDGYLLNEEQFAALGKAAALRGEKRAYVMNVEYWSHHPNALNQRLWTLDLDDYSSYSESEDTYLPFVYHGVFSLNGTWGALASCDFHAFVGGPAEFVGEMKANLEQSEEEMVREWLAYWRSHEYTALAPGVLKELLVHVYGDEKAEILLGL